MSDINDLQTQRPADTAVVSAYNKNLTAFQNHFLAEPAATTGQPQPTGRPYTRLDAVTAGISIITGWLVVLALVYLAISRWIGGVSAMSLVIYCYALGCIGYRFRGIIANYFKHAIRADLLLLEK